ncbi:MAG: helix-turn-helix transcriptional regulator [Oscillospiraceae bacterium]|nr:helix-turn-helix transcriptional regulator [Oscillospiraceae bacterium]
MGTKESMGAVIRRLRTEKGWTQEALAERLHLTPQAVSRWETELSLPDVSQVPQLARAFGVTTDALYGMEEEPEEDSELLLNAKMVYVSRDPERALAHWEKMAEKLREGDLGREQSNFRWTFLSLSVSLVDPESVIYVPERAEEVRKTALALGAGLPKQEENGFLRDQLRRSLARLCALDGQREAAFELLGENGFMELSQFQPAALGELWRLLGQRKLERQALNGLGNQIAYFLLDALYDAGDNALATGEAGKALEAAETALRIIPLLCGREDHLPALHLRERGDFFGLLARARAVLGDGEGALRALADMVDRRLALLSGDEQAVETALLITFPNSFHTSPEGKLYHRARLLRELGRPELKVLLDTPAGAALREKAERIGK